MGTLSRAGDLVGRPVVTLAGERVAEVKDVLFDRGDGHVQGFTLNNPGLFSRGRKDALPAAAAHGIGVAAVMVAGPEVFVPVDQVAPKAERRGGNVLADRVLTDSGTDLGKVVDVIVDLGSRPPDVVGYEIEPSEQLPGGAKRGAKRVLIPSPATVAVSGERLIVPAAVTDYISDDLAAFGAAVEAFRARAPQVASGEAAKTPGGDTPGGPEHAAADQRRGGAP